MSATHRALALCLSLGLLGVGCKSRQDSRHQVAAPNAESTATVGATSAGSQAMPENATTAVPPRPEGGVLRHGVAKDFVASPLDSAIPNSLDVQLALARKYAGPLGRARKLQLAGKLTDAESAFVEASGHGQDIYYRAIAGLGFLHLQSAGAPTESAVHELLVATSSPEAEVSALAWFNLAAHYRRAGRVEAERAALARSIARQSTAAAAKALGARSACVAEVGTVDVKASPAIVRGWSSVCKHLALCDETWTDEQEARRRACLFTSGTATEPDESHGCASEPPWLSTYGYQLYRWNQAHIAPMSQGRFLVDFGRVGNWPSICSGAYDSAGVLDGDVLLLRYVQTPSDVAAGHDAPQAGTDNSLCWDEPETQTNAYYSTETGQLLASIQLVDGHPVELRLDPAARRLELKGGGCDGFLRLNGARRLEPMPPPAKPAR